MGRRKSNLRGWDPGIRERRGSQTTFELRGCVLDRNDGLADGEDGLLEAHEQVTYGADMCWAGDAMRRDADKRNPLALFEMDATDAATRAIHAFEALWNASVPVPGRHLGTPGPVKPSAAYAPMDNAPLPAARKRIQGWPLVRH